MSQSRSSSTTLPLPIQPTNPSVDSDATQDANNPVSARNNHEIIVRIIYNGLVVSVSSENNPAGSISFSPVIKTAQPANLEFRIPMSEEQMEVLNRVTTFNASLTDQQSVIFEAGLKPETVDLEQKLRNSLSAASSLSPGLMPSKGETFTGATLHLLGPETGFYLRNPSGAETLICSFDDVVGLGKDSSSNAFSFGQLLPRSGSFGDICRSSNHGIFIGF